jgi:hypothetical protein
MRPGRFHQSSMMTGWNSMISSHPKRNTNTLRLPDRAKRFGLADFTVRSNRRESLDQCGSSNNAIRWILGIGRWRDSKHS